MSKAMMRRKRWPVSFTLWVMVMVAPVWGDDPPQKPDADKLPVPVQLTSQQDHKRIMELLDIKELRPGRQGHVPR
jgi:hypothetical protein